MDVAAFTRNRADFPVDELKKYEGQWVAFSADGTRIVAGADELGKLPELIAAAGEDPQEVGYERIVLEDDWQGAALELQ